MSRCMIAIPRPRLMGWPEGVRHLPWSTISMQTLPGSVQKGQLDGAVDGRAGVGVLDAVAGGLVHGQQQVIPPAPPSPTTNRSSHSATGHRAPAAVKLAQTQ
jgi:hypothetical protein